MDKIPSAFPIMTSALAERIEECCLAFWTEKVAVLRSLPGNPYGADIQRFGNTTALLTTAAHSLDFNRVGSPGEDDLQHLDEIANWYRQHGQSCRFEITPARTQPAILHKLTNMGYAHSSFHTVLYGVPTPNVSLHPLLPVRDVLPEERDLFAEIYLAGFALPQAPSALLLTRECSPPGRQRCGSLSLCSGQWYPCGNGDPLLLQQHWLSGHGGHPTNCPW